MDASTWYKQIVPMHGAIISINTLPVQRTSKSGMQLPPWKKFGED